MSDFVDIGGASIGQTTASRVAAYAELTKPKIAAMVLVSAAVGFHFARPGGMEASAAASLIAALMGIGLVAGGANALNQFIEARFDALMPRTRQRPIPTGRLTRADVLLFGLCLSVLGLVWLALVANPLAALLTAVTLVTYALVYTPIKRVTPLCVYVGAVPGALPPVIGWAAATGTLAPEAWYLFAIMYFWQLPHFAAIAWQYREDYAGGGYPMLSVGDDNGLRTSRHMMTHTVSLVLASLLPMFASMSGARYGLWAMILGLVFLGFGVSFVCRRTKANARAVVLASLVYLPLLFGVMMLDRPALG